MKMNANQAEAAYGVPRMTVGRWIRSGKLPADADGYFEEENFKKLNATRSKRPAPGRRSAVAPATTENKTTPKTIPKKKQTVVVKKTASVGISSSLPAPPPIADKLYPQVLKLCQKSDNPTITSLQRQLKIGYNRAARLLEAFKAGAAPGEESITTPAKESPPVDWAAPLPHTRQGIDLRKARANAKKAELEVQIKTKDMISRETVSQVFRKLYAIDSTEWRGLGPRLAPDIMAICQVEDPTKEAEISERIEREVFRTLGHVQRVLNGFLEEIESTTRVNDE